jgi:hypothetical protein
MLVEISKSEKPSNMVTPRRQAMKIRVGWILAGMAICATLITGFASAEEAKITVMNPRGIQPPIRLIPMAQRLETLDGKTIYFVDTKYPNTRPFVEEFVKALKEKYPKTNWVLKDKVGSYFDDDPKLWAEVKEKAQGVIMTIGH